MAATVTVRVPLAFWTDHQERMNPVDTCREIRCSSRQATIEGSLAQIEFLRADAAFYADPDALDAGAGLRRSAAATVRAIKAALDDHADRVYRETWEAVERWAERRDLPTWRPIAQASIGRSRPRATAWACDAFPGVEIHHCGHPTALRPYYLRGLQVARKFSRLALAQAAVAAIDAGEIKEGNL
jgi:hypothetical protein